MKKHLMIAVAASVIAFGNFGAALADDGVGISAKSVSPRIMAYVEKVNAKKALARIELAKFIKNKNALTAAAQNFNKNKYIN